MNKHIFIDRHGGFIYSEFLLTAIFLSVISVVAFHIFWALGIVIFIALWLSIDYLFFKYKLFRWIISTVWSGFYAYLIYYITLSLSPSDPEANASILATLAFCLMIYLHRREYLFEKSATVTVFDYYG